MHHTMNNKRIFWPLLSMLTLTAPAAAFDFGNMMNPGEWFNGNRDRDYYYDDYYGPPGGYGYPVGPYDAAPGYGVPGYAQPGYAAPGYTQPGYIAPGYTQPGYAQPGYSAPAYPSPSYSSPAWNAPANPSATSDADAAEIARLKQRVRELEAERAAADSAAPGQSYYESGNNAIQTWQRPMAPAVPESVPPGYGSPTAPQSWQPAGYPMPAAGEYRTPPAGSGAGQGDAAAVSGYAPAAAQPMAPGNADVGAAERSAAGYRPPPQYPGQSSYELNR